MNSINDAIKYTDDLIDHFPEFTIAHTIKAKILFENMKFNHLKIKDKMVDIEDPLIYHNLSLDTDPNSSIKYFARGEYYLESLITGINKERSNIILALIDFKIASKNQSISLLLDHCVKKLIDCLDFIIDEEIFDLEALILNSEEIKNRFLEAWDLKSISEFNVTEELKDLEKKYHKPWR
jgi:hypothetical protein